MEPLTKSSYQLVMSFLRDLTENYDHDEYYHEKGTHKTQCIVCKAEKVIREVEASLMQ